jgi:hypothetical protein
MKKSEADIVAEIGDLCGLLEHDYHVMLDYKKSGEFPKVIEAYTNRIKITSDYLDDKIEHLYNINPNH